MRIVVDLQGAQTESRFRGIGRYSLSLAQALVRNCGDHEIILALNGLFPETVDFIRDAFNDLLPQENIRVWHAPGPVFACDQDNHWRREAAEGLREAFLASLRPDVVLATSLFEGLGDDAVTSIGLFDKITPVAVILYDLIPLLRPDDHFKNSFLHQNWYNRKITSLKKSACLLAISESSRQEALSAGLGFNEEQIFNISGACEAWFRPLKLSKEGKKEIFQRFGIQKNFVMYTGGADERKNLPRLICAFAKLPAELRKNHQLLMVGKMPEQKVMEFIRIARKNGLKKEELIFTGYVDNADLVTLYNTCALFVFPSLHEGLGLPPLEAMACGAPVIAAKATSLPEIVGQEDALFDPNSETDIMKKMEQALCNEFFRATLVSHGLEQVKKFSWDQCAKRALKALEISVVSNNNISIPACIEKDAVLIKPQEQPINMEENQELIHCKNAANIIDDLIKWLASIEGVASNATLQRKLSAGIDLSIPSDNKKRQIFLDVSTLIHVDAKTGIQRVVRSLLQALLCNPDENYEIIPVYATQDRLGYYTARKFAKTFCGAKDEDKRFEERISIQAGDVFLGLDLAAHIVPLQRRFYEYLRRQGARVYFVVHDLLPIYMPQNFPKGVLTSFKPWLESIVENDGAVCISKSVAEELTNWVHSSRAHSQRPFHIFWFHLGADIKNSHPSKGLPQNAGLVLETVKAAISFLMVGTIEPRKGHVQALAAFEKLWQQNVEVNLIIVGKQGWNMEYFVDQLHHHEQFGKRLFWLDGISDEYLEKIYGAVHCLIAASEGEGFGLPLIEAAQHKLPIIARDIPVFREVAGMYASYFKGNEPGDLADALLIWLQLYNKGEHPKSDAMPYLVWKQSAEQLLERILPNSYK